MKLPRRQFLYLTASAASLSASSRMTRAQIMNPFVDLQPPALWTHFAEFAKIARPSKQERKLADYIAKWAASKAFEVKTDSAGNLCVVVPATAAREEARTVILQGHMDMVCIRDRDAGPFDPAQGNIRIIRATKKGDSFVETEDGEWIKADKTTLGADNGIGVAAMLAVCDDPAAWHGRLELLFTVDEETGLTGAFQLDPSLLTGKTLLNLDSEDDDLLTVGSAGGRETTLVWSRALAPVREGSIGMRLSVTRLRGGHSGVEINAGRLNAIHALARLLQEANNQAPLRLASAVGGDAANAIPREAFATVIIPAGTEAALHEAISRSYATLKAQYRQVEPMLLVNLSNDAIPESAFSEEDSGVLVQFLRAVPSGVISMSQKIAGLVETSTNVGMVKTTDGTVTVICNSRSSVGMALDDITNTILSVASLAKAKGQVGSAYPGWDPDPTSPVVSNVTAVYRRLFMSEPRVSAVHAGLECGIIGAKISGMDAVSFGPNIFGAHTIREAVNVASVKKFYGLLVAVLNDLSTKP